MRGPRSEVGPEPIFQALVTKLFSLARSPIERSDMPQKDRHDSIQDWGQTLSICPAGRFVTLAGFYRHSRTRIQWSVNERPGVNSTFGM